MPRLRKNVKDLTPQEKEDYVEAVKKLEEKPNGTGVSILEEFAEVHAAVTHLRFPDGNIQTVAHGSSSFVSWHRYFLETFEDELRKVKPGVTIPYWDWSDEESTKALFSPDFMGSHRVSKSPIPIPDGPFKDFKVGGTLIKRSMSPLEDVQHYASPKIIHDILNLPGRENSSSDYDTFRRALEFGPHGGLHNWVGGDMAVLATAARDPVFVIHHCNVDRLWSIWQMHNDPSPFPITTLPKETKGNIRSEPFWPWNNFASKPEASMREKKIRLDVLRKYVTNGQMIDFRDRRIGYDLDSGNLPISKVPDVQSVQKRIVESTSHIWKLSIKDIATYKIYTSGDTDIRIWLYGPQNCDNCFGPFSGKDENSGASGINASLRIPLQPGEYFVIVANEKPTGVSGSGNYSLSCEMLEGHKDEITKIVDEVPIHGNFKHMWEMDWFQFDVITEPRVTFISVTSDDSSPIQTSLRVFKKDSSIEGGRKLVLVEPHLNSIKERLEPAEYLLCVQSLMNLPAAYNVKRV